MNKLVPLLAGLLLFGAIVPAPAAHAAPPDGLMCELSNAADLVENNAHRPRFSWIVNSPHNDDVQTAYRLLIASSDAKLADDEGDIFDSGKILSDRSVSVDIGEAPLAAPATYSWKVKVWTARNGESEYSAPQKIRFTRKDADYSPSKAAILTTLHKPEKIVETNTSEGRRSYFVDFGKARFGTLNFVVRNGAGPVSLTFSEAVRDGQLNRGTAGTCYLNKTVALAADQLNEIGGDGNRFIMPFRAVKIEMDATLALDTDSLAQNARHVWFNDSAARFTSSHPLLNDIWALCHHTIKATTFVGRYIDGWRERMCYEGDAYINLLSHVCMDREYGIARATQAQLILRPTWPWEYKIASIFMAWEDYLYTGDERLIVRYYDRLKNKLGQEDETSTIPAIKTNFGGALVDWPPGYRDKYVYKGHESVATAFQYKGLLVMADIARVAGKPEDAETFTKRAAAVREGYNREFYVAETGLYRDSNGTDHVTLHSNFYALLFGLVPEDRKPAVVAYIKTRGMACGPYGAQFLLDALYEVDEGAYALDLMVSTERNSWYTMLNKFGSTMTMEVWDPTVERWGNPDWNHAWSTAAANVITRRLFGIMPLEPGCRKIAIKPQVGSLTEGSYHFPSVRGTVHVAFTQATNGALVLTTEIPANMTARVYLPSATGASLWIDGIEHKATREGRYLYVDNIGSGRRVISQRNTAMPALN